MLFAGGAEEPRDPKLPGMDITGVYYAMLYLVQQNRRNGAEMCPAKRQFWPAASMSPEF